MTAHRTSAIVAAGGRIVLEGLPFSAGEQVELIVLAEVPARSPHEAPTFPLPGPYRFDDPFTPVGLEDWDLLR